MSVASRAKPLRSLYGLGFTVTTGPPGGWAVSVRPLALRAAVAGGSLWAGVRAGQLHRPLMFPASRRLLGEPGLLIDICSRCPETTHRTEAWFWTVPTEGPQWARYRPTRPEAPFFAWQKAIPKDPRELPCTRLRIAASCGAAGWGNSLQPRCSRRQAMAFAFIAPRVVTPIEGAVAWRSLFPFRQ